MSNAHAGPSSWQTLVRLRLEERDARERAYDDMIEDYQRMLRFAKQHKDRNAKLLAAAGVGSSSSFLDITDSKATQSSQESEAVRLAYISSLEIEIAAAREEASTHAKASASSAQRLSSVDEQIREREDRAREAEDEVKRMREELTRMRRRDDDMRNNIEAKDKAIELLQDEMATLTLELGQAETRMEELKRDNASLLQRWLDRMNTEAERMNEGNKFLEDVDRRRTAASSGTVNEDGDPSQTPKRPQAREASSPATPKGKQK